MFGDFFNDVLGWGCVGFLLMLWALGWAASSIGKAAGDALKSDTVKEAAKIGFWAWFLSDDD